MDRGNGLRRAWARSGSGIVVFSLLLSPVLAQQIDDIVVTARKREENLQDVPLSISAFTAEDLQRRGVESAYDLALFTPNFNTQQQVGRTLDRPTIRGMANSSTNGEPNASYFLDGVFVSDSVATATTNTVDRIEVLRGPQSAQFGRATFSGAINYVTRQPSNVWEAQFNSRAGSDEEYKIGGWVSGPLIEDRLAFLVSGAFDTYAGQWRNNLQPNAAFVPEPLSVLIQDAPAEGDTSEMGGETTADFLLKLTWTPSETTVVNFKWGYTQGDDDHWPSLVPPGEYPANCYLPVDAQGNPTEYFETIPADPGDPLSEPRGSSGAFCGTFDPSGWENRINLPDFRQGVLAAGLANPNPEALRFAQPVDPGTRRETDRYLLDVTQAFGDWSVIARAAYNKDDFEQVFDLDHTEVRAVWNLFAFAQRALRDDQSYELRLASPVDHRISGQLGAYYFETERDNRVRSFTGPSVAFGAIDPCTGEITTTDYPCPTVTLTENVAVFGAVDVELTDLWTLSLEGRWADDRKSIVGGNQTRDEQSTKAFTPRVTLRYTPTADLMFYALAAKGNKPADFNVECFRADVLPEGTQECRDKQDLQRVKEEVQWTYELGTKTSWWDRRMTANLSLFYIDWDNQAIFAVDSIEATASGQPVFATFRRNAGKSRIYGLEWESNFVVTDNLFVIANYGFQDGEFTQGVDDFQGRTTGNADIAGNTIPNAPRHSVVLGGLATAAVSPSLEAFLRGDFVYESQRYTQAANFNQLGSRTLVNLRLGVEHEQWTVTGYVNNLLNDDTPWAALNFVDFNRTWPNGENGELWSLNPARGRHWGIEFQYRVGAR
jgi:iron complex outermembrane receptor protein